jgi:tripartite-type tricarboxylate transporter receptor subunit TctC
VKYLSIGLLAAFVFLGFGVVPPDVKSQEFYKDKTVSIVVGYSPGGSFDLYARVLARYMPGNPKIIVENMTGTNTRSFTLFRMTDQ